MSNFWKSIDAIRFKNATSCELVKLLLLKDRFENFWRIKTIQNPSRLKFSKIHIDALD